MTEPTVAGPRRPFSHETYTGAELETRSARPGAYDALALPSRMGDRQVTPGGARASLPSMKLTKPVPLQHRAAPPPPPTPPSPAKTPPSAEYRPRSGSVPHRVLEALALPAAGGLITHRNIERQFGLPIKQVLASFATAIEKGVLKRVDLQGEPALALPHVEVPAKNFIFTSGHVDAIKPDMHDRRYWPIEQPAERPPTPKTDAAADLQRALDSAQALAEIFVQLERQVLIVAALMGDAIARLSPPPASPFPTAA